MSTHAEPQVETCLPTAATRLFCNRTLNLRSIQAVGFDMDYTLVHYHTEAWERRCYEHVQERLLADLGWPVGHLRFDQDLVALGLIMDLECGNIVKANRFGFVRRASHGTRMLSFEEQKELYAQTTVDLAEPRWVFMNTLFALSEACLYAQAVDLLDRGEIEGTLGYRDLYDVIRNHIDQTHMEGQLKAEIVANPERFVSLDEDLPLVLRDLKASGKRVILITNSGWNYTQAMMRYVIDPFLPGGQRWRDLFDLVVVAARKPSFFAGNAPFYEVVEEERGLLKPVVGPLVTGGAYVGGHARAIEAHFDLAAEQILYVGDHIFADVKTSKSQLHWRTALIVRELEQELECLERFKPHQASLTEKMEAKELLEHRFSALRLAAQRKEQDYGPQVDSPLEALREAMKAVRLELLELDASISPLVQAASTLHHPRWGLLLRAGNDKSHLARQIERYADMYTSRVSNLLACTPFVYLRSPRGSLPHDSGPGGGV